MAEHASELSRILRADPLIMRALEQARSLGLPDWWIVSGAIYNSVWNALGGYPSGYGIKDIDLFYFDADTSWEAEDRQIRRASAIFDPTPPVELRNQARVHLWFEQRFGFPVAPVASAAESIANFAAITHAVGVRLEADGRLSIEAPYGLGAIFARRVEPNPRLPNRGSYATKAQRCRENWPEVTILPWPAGPDIERAGEDTDWNVLFELLCRAFAYMKGRIDPPSSLERLNPQTLAAKAVAESCYLAREGEQLRGCIFCAPDNAALYISKLAVDPAAQGQGIGAALMRAAEAHAAALGLAALELETRIELAETQAAFAALGFVKNAETAHPGHTRPTSVTMRKDLARRASARPFAREGVRVRGRQQ